ncbi:MAG: DUF502 domain-containing protein [Alphaproteobacteria bacterium]|nr:MAG: DUF502 domain-containing protein [Alphaproteobacteria bacterium]
MKKAFNALLARLRTYFFTGILVTVPGILTIYAVIFIVSSVDRVITPLLPGFIKHWILFQGVPGISFFIVLLSLVIIGAIMAGVIGKSVLGLGEKVVNKMPVVRTLYGGTKQILETMVSSKSNSFQKVVLVEFPCEGSWSLGFITTEAKGPVQKSLNNDCLSIFVPTTPVPTSGYLLFLPQERVRAVNMTVEEGLKMVISVGIVAPEEVSLPN